MTRKVARAVVILLCYVFATSEQMTVYQKAAIVSKENANTERAESESQPLQSFSKTPPRPTTRAFKPDESVQSSDNYEIFNTSPWDVEQFGSDAESFNAPDFDIILGQRVDFQDGEAGKQQVKNKMRNEKGHFKSDLHDRAIARVRRDVEVKDSEGNLTPRKNDPSERTTDHDQSDSRALKDTEYASSDDPTISESSGDGEVSDSVALNSTTLTSSATVTQSTDKTLEDSGHSAAVDQEGEPSGSVDCNTGAENQACWEPSVGEFDSEEGKSENDTMIDGEMKSEDDTKSDEAGKSDTEIDEEWKSGDETKGDDSANTSTSGRQDTGNEEFEDPKEDPKEDQSDQKSGENLDDENVQLPSNGVSDATTKLPLEPPEMTEKVEETKSTRGTESFTAGKESPVDEDVSSLSTTEESINARSENNETTNDKDILNNDATTPSQPGEYETTENTHGDQTINTPTDIGTDGTDTTPDSTEDQMATQENADDNPTTTEKIASPHTTKGLLGDLTKSPPDKEDDSTSTKAVDQTIPDISSPGTTTTQDVQTEKDTDSSKTDGTTAASTKEDSKEPLDDISTSTEAGKTTVQQDGTTETTTPVITTLGPVLGGPCRAPDGTGEETSHGEHNGCGDISNAECVDGACQCATDWYQLEDVCKERSLDGSYQLTLEQGTDKDSIEVSWPELSPSPDFNLLMYRVRWREMPLRHELINDLLRKTRVVRRPRSTSGNGIVQILGQDATNEDPSVILTNDTTAVIPGLTPGSKYMVEVRALIVMANEGRTEELWYPPGVFRLKPTCLSVKDYKIVGENRTMDLYFKNLEGTFNKCYLTVSAENTDEEGFSEIDCQKFALTHFEFGLEYKIQTKVTAGTNEETSCLWENTLLRENKNPNKVCNLEVIDKTSNGFTIRWQPPCLSHGYLKGYEVRLQSDVTCQLVKFGDTAESGQEEGDAETQGNQALSEKDCPTLAIENTTPIYDQQTFEFTRLTAGTKYQVEVFAFNENGRGEGDEESVIMPTLVPTPPMEFQGIAKGLSEVELTWEPPTPYPGLTDYIISTYMVLNWNPENTPKLFYQVEVSGYSTLSTVISNLKLATSYVFEIVAKTSAGTSDTASTKPVQTWENQSPQVTGLTLEEVTFDSMTLSWGKPSQDNGHTRAYVIIVRDSDKTCIKALAIVNDETDMGAAQPNVPNLDEAVFQTCDKQLLKNMTSSGKDLNTDLTVNGLEPNTHYILEVMAYNGAGLGVPAIENWKTINAVPNAPSQFSCSALNQLPGELYLSWSPPKPKPGMTSYNVTVVMAADADGQTFTTFGHYYSEGYHQDHLHLKGLRNFWQYKAFLNAKTPSGISSQVETEVCRTAPTVPGKVARLVARQNNLDFQVKWTCPNLEDRHGLLEYFVVQAKANSKNREDINLEKIRLTEVRVKARVDKEGLPDCTHSYTTTMRIVPQVSYAISVQVKVKSVGTLGAPYVLKVYANGADLSTDSIFSTYRAILSHVLATPPPLPDPVRKDVNREEQQPFTFRTTICPTCLVNSAYGQIVRYGLGVCKEGFCQVGSRANHNLEDYQNLATWKTAKAAQFKIPYQIFDKQWKNTVLAGAFVSKIDERTSYTNSSENQESLEYTVGNETSCASAPDTEFCNGPVPPDSAFRVFQFSCTMDGCSESSLSEVTVTAAAPLSSNPSSDRLVMGGAVSGVAAALIVIIIIVIVRIKFRKVIEITEKETAGDMQLSDIVSPSDPACDKSRPIKIKDFEETLQQLHANNDDLFAQEFTELDMDSTVHPTTVGSDPQYRKQNRWTNILPYDHTRVKLKVIDGDETCSDDYINANFLVGYRTAKDYIATQGPLTATVSDFWRMVWEQEVAVIVMLSAFKEQDKRTRQWREKVAQYYPSETDSKGWRCDHLSVSWKGKLDNQAWEVRTFHLTHALERRRRYVKHFFFKSWTDHEADISPQDLINFVTTVRQEAESHPPGPIVVHCSAGVGRTGTFIAVDYFCRYIKDLTKGSRLSNISDIMGSLKGSWAKRKSVLWEDNTVDIYGRIIALRDCRRYMVQTRAQYAFIYDTVMELIRRAYGSDDTSDSGETESCLSGSVPAPGTPGNSDAVYDDVDVLKR